MLEEGRTTIRVKERQREREGNERTRKRKIRRGKSFGCFGMPETGDDSTLYPSAKFMSRCAAGVDRLTAKLRN